MGNAGIDAVALKGWIEGQLVVPSPNGVSVSHDEALALLEAGLATMETALSSEGEPPPAGMQTKNATSTSKTEHAMAGRPPIVEHTQALRSCIRWTASGDGQRLTLKRAEKLSLLEATPHPHRPDSRRHVG